MPFAGLANGGGLEHFAQKALPRICAVRCNRRDAGLCAVADAQGIPVSTEQSVVEAHLLIVPMLVHIRRQPQSSQNTLHGGDTALPFPKGAPPANRLQPPGPVQPV